jgi:UDP-3-O-[3-hydroxymyristoyl] N-acetylglucosamine deacetylase
MIKQRTIRSEIRASGVGLHTGKKVCLTLRPAVADTGIVFRRIDLPIPVEIKASPENIGQSRLSTVLVNGELHIFTIEHLMSALAGLGIDNAYVDLDAPEVPIMDGSAGPFVFLLQSAGIQELEKAKRFIRIKHSVIIQEQEKWTRFDPFEGFKITLRFDLQLPEFQNFSQTTSVDFSRSSFINDVPRTRTLGFVREIEKSRENDLAVSDCLDNTAAMGRRDSIHKDGSCYEDEFVKHKVLDIIGDLCLLGCGIVGEFSGYKSGHTLNAKLLMALLKDQDAWETAIFDGQEDPPVSYIQP